MKLRQGRSAGKSFRFHICTQVWQPRRGRRSFPLVQCVSLTHNQQRAISRSLSFSPSLPPRRRKVCHVFCLCKLRLPEAAHDNRQGNNNEEKKSNNKKRRATTTRGRAATTTSRRRTATTTRGTTTRSRASAAAAIVRGSLGRQKILINVYFRFA